MTIRFGILRQAAGSDPHRGQPLEPIGFGEDGGGRNDEGCRSVGERRGEIAPIGDRGGA